MKSVFRRLSICLVTAIMAACSGGSDSIGSQNGLSIELIDRPIALLLAAVLVGATSLLTLRAGPLPRWHGWVSGVLAALFVVGSGLEGVFGPPLGAPAILFPLWVLATSVVLIGRVGSSDEGDLRLASSTFGMLCGGHRRLSDGRPARRG